MNKIWVLVSVGVVLLSIQDAVSAEGSRVLLEKSTDVGAETSPYRRKLLCQISSTEAFISEAHGPAEYSKKVPIVLGSKIETLILASAKSEQTLSEGNKDSGQISYKTYQWPTVAEVPSGQPVPPVPEANPAPAVQPEPVIRTFYAQGASIVITSGEEVVFLKNLIDSICPN